MINKLDEKLPYVSDRNCPYQREILIWGEINKSLSYFYTDRADSRFSQQIAWAMANQESPRYWQQFLANCLGRPNLRLCSIHKYLKLNGHGHFVLGYNLEAKS